MDSGDADVGEPLNTVLERARADRRLFGDRKVARTGRADQYSAPPRRRGLGIGREICRATELIELDAREAHGERLRLVFFYAGGEKAAARRFETFRDRHHLAGGLAQTKDHLLMPLGNGPEVIDRREAELLEVHAADLT